MLIRRRSAVVHAAPLLTGMLMTLSAMAAQAPARGVHHFALADSTPTHSGPDDPQKPDSPITTWKVPLSGADTEGLVTLQDEIWSAQFDVPLHFHKKHAETFYILDGEVEWTVGGETHVMHPGDLVYIPPNTPHKVRVIGGKPMHTLFFSLPGGYEDQEALRGKFSKEEMNAPAAKAYSDALDDFNALPDDTPIPSDTAGPEPHRGVHHFSLQGHIRKAVNRSGNVTSLISLSGDQSEGRYTFQDESWPADFNVELHYHKRHSEIFYLLGGEIEWTVDGETHNMHAGDVVYIPPNTPHKVHVAGGKPAHLLFIQSPGGYEINVDLANEYSKAELSRPGAKAALAALHDFNKLQDRSPYEPK